MIGPRVVLLKDMVYAPRGKARFWFFDLVEEDFEPGDDVRVRMRFVKKPGAKRRTWVAKLFLVIPKREEIHELTAYDL
jgi:hypothetical protein